MQPWANRTAVAILVAVAASGCIDRESGMNSRQSIARSLDADDDSAVRLIVAQFADAWNRHDMNAMHALDTDDVEWINVTANHWRGKAAVYKGHDTIHRTIFAKTDMSILDAAARSLAPGVAVVVATMKFGPVISPTGQTAPELKTRGTFTMVKRDGIWKIAHFQNTSVDLDAEKDDPITWDETGFLPGGISKTN
jgi:uncharacterized protein (TIGR02246 family)